MVSAPPESVTVDHVPGKAPHTPLVSVAVSRSTKPDVASTPDAASAPFVRVSGTDSVEYPGPPTSVAVIPVGPVASAAIVIVWLAVFPAKSVAVTFWTPGAAAPADHEYVTGLV